MTNQQLRDQFARCLEWQDPAQWDALAQCFFAAGFVLNAGYCWQRADILRGCSFSESMTARAQPLAGVVVEG
jgi:hypothetical protein